LYLNKKAESMPYSINEKTALKIKEVLAQGQ